MLLCLKCDLCLCVLLSFVNFSENILLYLLLVIFVLLLLVFVRLKIKFAYIDIYTY